MFKPVLAGLAALSIAGASLAYAQQSPPADAPRWRPSAEDRAALVDARIAAMRAGLKLTAEQEKHWPAAEAAMRAFAKERTDRMAARRDARRGDSRPDALDRMRRGADAMSAMGNSLRQLADATEPLYRSLDDSQKHRFALLMRMGRHGASPWRRPG